MFGKSNPNRLIVEGYADLFSVVALMSAHIDWPLDKGNAPVWIEIGGSVEEILEDGYLKVHLMSRETKTLGVVLDADANPSGRYASFSHRCEQFFRLPKDLPKDGLVADGTDGKRLGLWVMPDNASKGCLETFLKYLVPDALEPTWKYATECVTKARELGCKCKEPHVAKANLYTWLAWHDPPGQSPGASLTKKVLDPHSPNAAAFVKWFRGLYKL